MIRRAVPWLVFAGLACRILASEVRAGDHDGWGAPGASGVRHEMVAVIHLHTTLSDGSATPLELARAARAAGVDALIVTDHFLERVAYAPWPLGNALGVAASRPSVVSHGIRRYFASLSEAERLTGGIVLVPGLEVTPYARWEGSFLRSTLELQGWHRHALVVGIDDPAVAARLPVAGNRHGGIYGPWSLLFAAPAAALLWSAARLTRPVYRERRVGPYRLRQRRLPAVEALVCAAALLVLVVGFPYRVERFSPVSADPGDAPLRRFVDFARGAGGVVIWAHPEAEALKEDRGIRLRTARYPEVVRRTEAQAFAALPEGVVTLLPPGGLWDRTLIDFLEARRRTAPFAIAEVDEHRAAAEIDFGQLQTVFLVRDRSRSGLMEALGSGRFYARWTPEKKEPLRLLEWTLRAAGPAVGGHAVAGAGESIAARGEVAIRLRVAGGGGEAVAARLLRRGEVIWSARGVPPLEYIIPDLVISPTYYRLDVEGAYPRRLISNPIFVTSGEGA
jgi:hypothetical protein